MKGPYGPGTAPCNGCTENNRGPVAASNTVCVLLKRGWIFWSPMQVVPVHLTSCGVYWWVATSPSASGISSICISDRGYVLDSSSCLLNIIESTKASRDRKGWLILRAAVVLSSVLRANLQLQVATKLIPTFGDHYIGRICTYSSNIVVPDIARIETGRCCMCRQYPEKIHIWSQLTWLLVVPSCIPQF